MRRSNRLAEVLAFTAFTITATGALAAAEPDHATKQPDRAIDRSAQPANSGRRVFELASKMVGMDVENAEHKDLGSVDDMIIDRGSGRVKYLVLKSGTFLGMGGKLVTVPYGAFGWDADHKSITLSATMEQIKGWPEFDKKRWMDGARSEDSYVRTIGKDYYDYTGSPWPVEAKDYASTPVKGTIHSFTRTSTDNGREELVMVVSSPGAPNREIILGPSWYMAGNNSIAFFRDAPVEVNVFTYDRDGRKVQVARSATINGKEMTFYDTQGRAMWAPNASDSSRDAFSAAPFFLYSEIKGKPVDCRGEKCGEVENLLVECTTGVAGFLVIDPDAALLGIGDEKRLVPWTIMSRSLDGKVHLDASKKMITSGPTLPKDLKDLSDMTVSDRVYSAYDVQPARFDSSRR